MGEVLAEAGHNVTLIRLQIFEYGKSIQIPTKPGMEEWTVNGLLKHVDYEWVRAQQTLLTFSDESMWSYLRSDKWEVMQKMMSAMHDSCERK